MRLLARLLLMVLALLCAAPLVHAQDTGPTAPAALDPSTVPLVPMMPAPPTPRDPFTDHRFFEDVFRWSQFFVLSGHAFDLAATEHCLGAGTCREMNPWLGRFESPVAFTAAKFSIAFVQLWAVRELKEHGHPRLALAANLALAGGFTALGIRNERLTR